MLCNDKRYDSEKIHVLMREEIKADSIYTFKAEKKEKRRGKSRKQLHLFLTKLNTIKGICQR